MSLSYHHLHLADSSIRIVAVYRGLALHIPLRHGSKFVRRPVAIEPVLGLLVLGQIDPVDLGGLHLPLQHLCAKKNYVCMSK
jgi:hypothetical protein